MRGRIVCWTVPLEDGVGSRTIEEPEEVCIALQRREAREINNFEYESDEDALEDFMSIHWAWFKELPADD